MRSFNTTLVLLRVAVLGVGLDLLPAFQHHSGAIEGATIRVYSALVCSVSTPLWCY